MKFLIAYLRKCLSLGEESAKVYTDNVINNVPHFIFWKNTDSIFLGCNTAFAKAAGFQSPDDVIGKTDHEMPWCHNADHYLEDDKRIMELVDSKLDYEEEQRQADGGTNIFWVASNPFIWGICKSISTTSGF